MDICASNLRGCPEELGKETFTLGERDDDFSLGKASSRWLITCRWSSRGRPGTEG